MASFLFIFFYLIIFLKFYLFSREHKKGRGREGGTNDLQQGLCDSRELSVGLELTNHDLSQSRALS